jgi:hypothetical protein
VFGGENYTVYYSGSFGARSVFGTGHFLEYKKLKQHIMKFEPAIAV